jgi:hypothetical protein
MTIVQRAEWQVSMIEAFLNSPPPKQGNSLPKNHEPEGQLTADLRHAAEQFIEAADHADSDTAASMYAPDFVNIRITDAGDVVRLNREQLLSFFARPGGQHIPTKSSTIHHVEVTADSGFVLLTRIKDLGNGWEPMFYSLVWERQGDKWLLLREFVHQRSIPKRLQFTK